MRLPLQIVFRDMAPLPSVAPEIRRRAHKLDEWTPHVMSCHVAVEAEGNRHRTGHAYRVAIRVRVPDEEIVAGSHQADEDIHRAIRGAFDAADRQLEDYARRRRGQVKPHREVLRGRIESLSDDGTGVIFSQAGEAFHFDRSHVAQPDFEQLAVGQEVRFLEGVTRAGREAHRVVGSHEPPLLG